MPATDFCGRPESAVFRFIHVFMTQFKLLLQLIIKVRKYLHLSPENVRNGYVMPDTHLFFLII